MQEYAPAQHGFFVPACRRRDSIPSPRFWIARRSGRTATGSSPSTVTTPAFDGQWVVFRDNGSKDDGSLQAIWSFNTKDGTFHKLADLHTVQPGGTATFTELHLLDTAPAVRNGTVIFLAAVRVHRPPGRSLFGAGGRRRGHVKVADYRTADPSGGTFTLFDSSGKQIGGFGFDGTTVAFHGQGSTLSVGIYAARRTDRPSA
jgi:hypothetical protein